LEDINSYSFLNNGDLPLPNVDDVREFSETRKSMKIMGFEDTETAGNH
jgi:myosin heavy subunit